MVEAHHQKIRNHDRINSLSNGPLSHILSFLPTKHVVLTSILSHRWRDIWRLVPNLDFNDSLTPNPNCSEYNNRCFSGFVDRVLMFRDNSSPIQTFHLECHLEYDYTRLENWIGYAVEFGVHKLDVGYFYYPEDTVQLPKKNFTLEKLEVLKLRRFFHLDVPDSIRLPKLRVLHLMKVLRYSDSSINNLICSCPVLEELVIEREFYDTLSILRISSNSLKVLKIDSHVEDDEEHNICKVTINAPKLKYFDLRNLISRTFDMSVFPFLVKASIDVVEFIDEHGDATDIHKNNLVNLLTGIAGVQFLSLSSSIMNTLEIVSGIPMPTFYKLTHLEENGKDMCMPDLEVNCLLRLEIISIKGFQCCKADMLLIRKLAKSAKMLKKFMIYTGDVGLEIAQTFLKRLRRT